MAVPKGRYKIWKASGDTSAGFMVTPDFAVMAGSKDSFVLTSKEGVHISGPVSFITTGEQTRQAGLFVRMNDFIRMVPSTIVTPIPFLLPIPPVALFTSVALTMPFAVAMLAA